MTFASRFKSARKAKRLSQTAIAKLLGVSRNAVSMWEAGKSTPASNRLAKAAVILGKGVDWLATGRPGKTEQVGGLPLRGEVAAGVWFEVSENQDAHVESVPVAPDPRFPADSQYALRVRGTSVNRIAADGAIITCVDVISAGIDPRDGDLVWVERRRGDLVEATVKRLRKGKSGLELWPESDDPAHQEKLPLKAPKGDYEITIKALVIGAYRPIQRGQ